MKAAFVKDRAVSVTESEEPGMGEGDVLVRMESCGICGSDVEKVFGEYSKPSMRLGHEPAGTVLKVGAGVSGLRPGDRVFTHHHVACGRCELCSRGRQTLCERYSASNLQPCGLAERYVVPEWNVRGGGVLKLPESVSFEAAAMIEPLACCVRAWNRIGAAACGYVAVFGAGPTGLMHAMLARHYGAKSVACVDPNHSRLEFAKNLGISEGILASDSTPLQIMQETGQTGADIVIVATASTRAIGHAIESARKGGTVMLFGVPSRGAVMSLDVESVYSKELRILTSYAAAEEDTSAALDLIASGSIRAETLVTHRFCLEDSQRAFETAKSGENAMKVVISGDAQTSEPK